MSRVVGGASLADAEIVARANDPEEEYRAVDDPGGPERMVSAWAAAGTGGPCVQSAARAIRRGQFGLWLSLDDLRSAVRMGLDRRAVREARVIYLTHKLHDLRRRQSCQARIPRRASRSVGCRRRGSRRVTAATRAGPSDDPGPGDLDPAGFARTGGAL